MKLPLKIEKHHHDEIMSNAEIRRRFRWALFGYFILMIATIAGLAWSLAEQQSIKDSQTQLKAEQAALKVTQARQRQVLINANRQRQQIKSTQGQIIASAQHDCALVVDVESVFAAYVAKDIALRRMQLAASSTPAPTKAYDRALIRYWTTVTMPQAFAALNQGCPTVTANGSP